MKGDAYLTVGSTSVVLDPVGGARGERALRLARDACIEALDLAPADLPGALEAANARVREAAREDTGLLGGTCSAVGVVLGPTSVTVAWMGDACALRYRGTTLTLLTQPHVLVREYQRMAMLDPEFPPPDLLVRAIGARDDAEVEVRSEAVLPGDLFLLATDAVLRAFGDGLDAFMAQAVARSGRSATALSRELLAGAWARNDGNLLTVLVTGAGDDEELRPVAASSFPKSA
jgi:hypothetical protein